MDLKKIQINGLMQFFWMSFTALNSNFKHIVFILRCFAERILGNVN